MKITNKFILSFFTVALVVLVIGVFFAQKSREILQDTIGKDSVLLARNTLDKIDRAIFNRIEEMQAYGKDEILQGAIAKSNEEFGKLDNIQNYIDERDKEWTSLPEETLSSFMQRIMSTELSKELTEKKEFYEKKYGHTVFAEIFVTNQYGANISQTGRTSDYRQDDEEWWQIARKDGFYLADVGYDESADVYSIDICLRIDDDNENFLGVMKIVLNIEEVIRVVKELSPGKDKEYGKHGIYGSEGHKSMKFLLLTDNRKIIFSAEQSEFLQDVPDTLFSRLEKTHNPDYFIMDYGPDRGEKMFSHAHSEGYRDFKGLGWTLVVEHGAEIFSLVDKLWDLLMIMLSAVTASALLLVLFLSRSIAAPIVRLKEKMAEVGRGRLDTTIDIKSNDEIGDLAKSFNDMLEHLNKSTASIEDLNKEIAERVKLTEKLSKAYAELKATQSRMLHREKLASVGQLAAGVAHEINNPVGFIASNLGTLAKYVDRMIEFINAQKKAIRDESAEELQELGKKLKIDYLTEDAKDLVKESLDGTDRVNKIVQGLKSFSRVDEVEFKPADINECLESTLNMVWNELKYLATVTKEYGDLPLIKCYPRQLNQVFMNLLINAAHAIEKQGEISIKTWHQDDSIFVSISDTGQGIPADNLNKLFDPFFTTKDVGKGTGLGLSIAHGIIQKHNGEINVQSEVGKGSTFTIMLPAV